MLSAEHEIESNAEEVRPGFYRIDASRISFREFWWGGKIAGPITWLASRLGATIPSSTDDLNVEWLVPFEVAGDALPEEVRARFEPAERALSAKGFCSPIYHMVVDPVHSTRSYLATYCHDSGRAFGRIHYRRWTAVHPARDFFFTEFVSEFHDGTYLWSTSAQPDMIEPECCTINRVTGADVEALWASHLQRLAEINRRIVPVRSVDELAVAVERHHAVVRDYHVKRGVFAAVPEEQAQQAISANGVGEGGDVTDEHADVLAEIARQQQKQTSWKSTLTILAVSMLLFVGAGSSFWSWQFVLMLIPILLFHELGHYLAMRLFGYRNVRMLFLPFLGAAVIGQNYNVAGWKKAIVSLMGPLPGIAVGSVLGVVGLLLQQDFIVHAALLTLILNAFNLLPVLPLDGGWVMHTLLFSRHYMLDVVFRALAGLALVSSGLLGERILMYLGIVVLLGVPLSYRLGRITHDLRRSGLRPVSPDDQSVPPDVAQVIVSRLKEAFPRGLGTRNLAQHTLHVFETLNARPPSWPTTIGLATVHGAGFIAALLFGMFFVVGQNGGLQALLRGLQFDPPQYAIAAEEMAFHAGAEAREAQAGGRSTIIATLATPEEARRVFEDLSVRIPAQASLRLFGQSLMLAFPKDADEIRREYFGEMESYAHDVFVDGGGMAATLYVTCVAPSEWIGGEVFEEVEAYLNLVHLNLVPPWQVEDDRSAEEWQRHRVARRTYMKLQYAGGESYLDPEVEAIEERMSIAHRSGDRREVTRLQEEQRVKMAELQRREIEKLVAEDAELDERVVEMYLELVESGLEEYSEEYMSELSRRLGPVMGQLPMAEDGPTPGANVMAARHGWASREEESIRLYWLGFVDVFEGAPALVQWLADAGCTDLRYELEYQAWFDPEEEGIW